MGLPRLSSKQAVLKTGSAPNYLGDVTDAEAVALWLATCVGGKYSKYTVASYHREAERFLLWLEHRGASLRKLTQPLCLSYEAFLADPQPAHQWVGPRRRRDDPDWKPFEGGLKPASIRQAMLILNGMLNWLVKAGYLAGNPMALLKTRRRLQPAAGLRSRMFDDAMWRAIVAAVESMPRGSPDRDMAYERARFLACALYLSGLRLGEISNLTMGAFYPVRRAEGTQWWLRVTGKGGKTRDIPVADDLLQALRRYRTHLGLSELPQPGEERHLLMNLGGNGKIGANMVYRIIKEMARGAADLMERRDPDSAHWLRQASTHWFRHTAISRELDSGVDLLHVRDKAGHVSLDTTSLYAHSRRDRWHSDIQKHVLNWE